MFFAEIKRKYFNIIFVFVSIIGVWWLYSALKPTATTNVGDFYKYNYFKPLNKAEFVYFNLTTDYKKGGTLAYYEPKENSTWGIYTKKLNDIEKEYFLSIIKKINPSYSNSEKMNDIHIDMSYSEMKPYLKELEEKLGIVSFYYTGMNDTGYYNKGYKDSNSPYWVYKKCTPRFHGKKYKTILKDFTLTYEHGISNGYAAVALDSLGIIIGLFAIVYSFKSYAEEKRAETNGYIYTGNTSSAKFVLCRYLATVVPLMVLSVIYILFEAAYFMYLNKQFSYGYEISALPFLSQTIFIIFPEILIITALGHFLGILFQSEIITVIIQFILFYLSMSNVPTHKFSLNMIVRYSSFDDYSFYQSYFDNILPNRIIIIALSVFLTVLVVKLFDYRREHDRLANLASIKKVCISFFSAFYKKESHKKHTVAIRGLGYYIFKQSINKSALLYIPYICFMYFVVVTPNMSVLAIATIGENIIIFASIFLFVRLGNMEHVNGVESYVFTSKSFYPCIYMLRLIFTSVVLFIMVEIPVVFLCITSHLPIGRWCIGVYLSSLFIGTFSLLVAELFESYFAGYFAYVMYYFINVVLKSIIPLNVLGYTYLLQKSKPRLSIAVIVMMLMLSVIAYIKSKGISLVRRKWK